MGNTDKTLQDKDYLNIYPITRERNVYDENNVNLKTKFENVVFKDNDVHKFAEELRNESANEFPYKLNEISYADGQTINNDTGNIAYWGGYCACLDYIPIDGNATYTLRIMETQPYTTIAFYDSNKKYISGITRATGFTTPNGTKYMRFGSQALYSNWEYIMLNKGTEPLHPQEYNPNRHITNGEAEHLKEEFGKQSNLFNENDVEYAYIDATGHVGNSDVTITSKYIKVKPNTTYRLYSSNNETLSRGFCFYDTNKKYISGNTWNGITGTINTPSNCEYIRVSFPKGYTSMMNEGTELLPYQPYNSSSHITNPQADLLKSEWEKGLNLFNYKNNKTGFLNKDTGAINTSNVEWEYGEDYIKAQPNTTYTLSWVGGTFYQANICYYDASKNFVSGTNLEKANTTAMSFTTPNNTSYIRVSYTISNNIDGDITKTNVMLNKGPEALPYQPYNGPIIHEKDITPVLLWKNGSPNAEFAEQTININGTLDNYEYITIVYKQLKGSGSQPVLHKFKNLKAYGNDYNTNISYCAGTTTQSIRTRYFAFPTATTITVGAGYVGNGLNNSAIVPYEIYGSKY